jgi:hypothetical protein
MPIAIPVVPAPAATDAKRSLEGACLSLSRSPASRAFSVGRTHRGIARRCGRLLGSRRRTMRKDDNSLPSWLGPDIVFFRKADKSAGASGEPAVAPRAGRERASASRTGNGSKMAPQAIEIAGNGSKMASCQLTVCLRRPPSNQAKHSKKLRKRALKPLKSLARVNLCAGRQV